MSIKGTYPKSKKGNFFIKDETPVPHPYCITPKHVVYAADHCYGILNKTTIQEAEKHGAKCGICKGKLSHEEHGKALLVSCLKEANGTMNKELHQWLLSIKEIAEQSGYQGFVFAEGGEQNETHMET